VKSKRSMVPNGTLPWSRSCFVCGQDNERGLRLMSRLEDGNVILEYRTRVSDAGYRSLVHGGISMTLLDEVMTWASIVALQRLCVAAELKVRLRIPVRPGEKLRVEGRVAERKTRLVETEAQVWNEAGEEVASACGKYLPLPDEDIEECMSDFVASSKSLKPEEILTHDKGAARKRNVRCSGL